MSAIGQPEGLPDLSRIRAELAAPLYPVSIRDTSRKAMDGEIAIGDAVTLDAPAGVTEALGATRPQFEAFLRTAMDLAVSDEGYRIALGMESETAGGAPQSFRVRVTPEATYVTGSDADGLRRGLFRLEEEMTLRRAPVLPLGETERRCVITRRIGRSPIATYRWNTGSELLIDNEPYPEAYLARLARMGINGVWVTGRFKDLLASRVIPEMGPPESRLGKLANLVERAARHGIGVYFFCMEPRITLDTEIFDTYPDIRGARMPPEKSRGEIAFCSSAPRVHEYIRDIMGELFTRAPGLAGVIHLFSGERSSGCFYPAEAQPTCPRCSKRDRVEIIAEFLDSFHAGIAAVAPEAELLAWDYGPAPYKIEALSRSHPDIVLTSCFEHGGRKVICGAERDIEEYSLSYVGPSPIYETGQERCRREGRKVYAKIQIGNTYELSSQPHIPVPASVYRKFKAMQEGGTTGALVSWIIGGAPSLMLHAAGLAAYAPLEEEDAFLLRLAGIRWGEACAATVREAWRRFFDAFDLYPMQNPVFYFGPIIRCPAYQLHLEKEEALAKPYNWGLDTERNLHPWEDDPARWCGADPATGNHENPGTCDAPPLTPENLIETFRRMASIWKEGVALLEEALHVRSGAPDVEELRADLAVAQGIGIQFASCANVVEFYAVRKTWEGVPEGETARRNDLLRSMREAAEADRDCAEAMLPLFEANPWIGFESEIYFFSISPDLVRRKMEQTDTLLRQIDAMLEEARSAEPAEEDTSLDLRKG